MRARAVPVRLLALLATSALLGLGLGAPGAHGATGPVTVDMVQSTADGSLHAAASQRIVDPGAVSGAPAVTVFLDRARQRVHGVGAALTESSAHLLAQLSPTARHDALMALFAPGQGDLSVLRLVIGASDFSLEHHSLDDSPAPDPMLTRFSIERDRRWVIPVLREILAIAPDIEIVASPWSAPGWMKNSGSYLFGKLQATYEAAYIAYLVRYLDAYRAAGIDIRWLTLQNEPAAVQLDYPSMLMDPEQQSRLLAALGPALVAAHLDTRVLAWDHNWCDARPPGGCAGPAPASFPLTVLDRTGATHPLGGVAYHCYGGDQATANDAVHDRWPGGQIWLTECSGGTWQADPFVATADLLVTDRNHWSNATLLWNLALDPDGGPHLGGCGTCRGVLTVDPNGDHWERQVDLDVLATTARFGPQGSGVLETTSSVDDIRATGVCSPQGRPAAVVLNAGAARTMTLRFGTLALPIELAERSLTSVRAPEGVACRLAAWPELPAPKSAPPSTPTDARPAEAVPGRADFTG